MMLQECQLVEDQEAVVLLHVVEDQEAVVEHLQSPLRRL